MKNILLFTTLLLLSAVSTIATAQDDLMNLLNADSAKLTRVTSATFKGTRVQWFALIVAVARLW